jgi:hypothetical protein
MLARLRNLFLSPKSLPPVLVRVRIPGGVAEGPVDVVARAHPRGATAARVLTTRVQAAQGVCVVPWLGGAGLELELGHATHRGALSLLAEDVEDGEVQEVALA